ncbi:hypothetical protein [Sporomusa ovata]|uniref:hypothetical protein n=1 Tax=Sporomusa ovata TaxID=2378 RepID=UPI00048DECA7|nr:hypothetical protein [Sporomusa ovata]
MEWAEPIAYGPLELMPWQFGRLQPYELMDLWDGYQWRRKNNDDTLAYYVCRLMNLQLKDPIQPAQISRFNEDPEIKKKTEVEYLQERFKDALKE